MAFYDNGLFFECKRCSHCCTKEAGFVYLSENDLSLLLKWTGLSRKDFIAKYCRYVQYYGNLKALCLLEKPNYDCIFWDSGCLCYDFRPVQCRTYPFWTYLLKSRHAWDLNKEDCPGINSGEILHTALEINAQKDLYENNLPITIDATET